MDASFYIQLQGKLKEKPAMYYDIDLCDNQKQVREISKKHKVICYFSAGTSEDWRPDFKSFPKSAIGKPLEWKGENWLDVRNLNVRSIMKKRLDLAKDSGCYGVDPDNMDVYTQKSGFTISKSEQIDYNTFIANEAHRRNLKVGLKNNAELSDTLSKIYDFSVVEECSRYKECAKYSAFYKANKPVFAIEYTPYNEDQCKQAKSLGITLGFYNLGLNGNTFQGCK